VRRGKIEPVRRATARTAHEIPTPPVQVDEPAVVALAEEGRLRVRRVAGRSRVARRALIAWLSVCPTGMEVYPHG
jgi:hypothetical protein